MEGQAFDQLVGSSPFGLDTGSEAGRERVRLAVENFGLAFFESDVATGHVVVTPNAFGLFGLMAPPGMPVAASPFWDCYHPDDRERARALFEADLRGERGRDTYTERVRIIRRSDHQVRWIEFSGRMFGPPGARTHIVGMLRDVTGQIEAEERQALLMREVDHRANNVLAVVQALVRLTRGAGTEDYRRTLEQRILSLARTHSLLGRPSARATEIRSIMDSELAAYRDHVDAELGPIPPLAAAAVQPVAMTFHELATNAAKHGAFSAFAGRVRIEARVEDTDVMLRWTESGGPCIAAPPVRRGTGMAVIQAQVRRLGGMLEYGWHARGLRVEARFPIASWSA